MNLVKRLLDQKGRGAVSVASSEQMNEQLANYIWGLPPERRMASDG